MANTFRELRVYRSATEISNAVWALRSAIQPNSPAIWYQLDKSAGSIEDNIAEGFGRETRADFANFLRYSRGSAMEAESQIARARRRDLIDEAESESLIQLCRTITVQLRNFQQSLKSGKQLPLNPNMVRDVRVPYGQDPDEAYSRELPHWWDEPSDY